MRDWLQWILQGNLPYLDLWIEGDFEGYQIDARIAWIWTPRLLKQGAAPWLPYQRQAFADWLEMEEAIDG